MHHFLPLERLTSHAPGHHNTEGAWKGSGAQPDSAPLARGFSAEPGGDPARVGYCAESPPRCCRPSFPGFGSRNSAFISKRTTLRLRSTASRVIQLTVLSLIRTYQVFFSPLFLPACRYQPTCSVYAYEAVQEWGVWSGLGISLRRLLRCHPFGAYGYDPAPRRSSQGFEPPGEQTGHFGLVESQSQP